MKLLLRRDQQHAMLGGKPLFTLIVRADMSEDEKRDIENYNLGNTMLYQSHEVSGGTGLIGLIARAFLRAMTISVSVKDLVSGKKIECKDIVEMVEIEAHIRTAAQNFVEVLRTAAQFGGEEVVEI